MILSIKEHFKPGFMVLYPIFYGNTKELQCTTSQFDIAVIL